MYKTLSTNTILERLAWISDRRKYRAACHITNGATYAEECKAESELLAELDRRYKESKATGRKGRKMTIEEKAVLQKAAEWYCGGDYKEVMTFWRRSDWYVVLWMYANREEIEYYESIVPAM